MKYLVQILLIFILYIPNLNSDEKSSFINTSSKFHVLNIFANAKNKKDASCVYCHIVDDIKNTKKEWLQPTKEIKGDIFNFDATNGFLDPFSKACLICHDGSMASLVLNAPISPCGLKKITPVSSNGANHSVFM